MEIMDLLRQAEAKLASDLHLIASSPPLLRIDGELQILDSSAPKLTAENINQLFEQITTPQQRKTFSQDLELDFGFSMPGGSRLRCNACQQQGAISLAIRLLPPKIPTIDELGLPQICKDLIARARGLIIVTGPTGSGKTTTLAAMIQHLNQTDNRYVITIEDPIEYRHPNIKCTVSQRELSVDTYSYASALKYVLRQDPDVILIGEMRDLETAATVLTVAETGHLILSTGHAPSAAQSIERIIDLFPPHERYMAQARLASVLVGVLCQTLVPRIKGGRIAAVEIMLANSVVKNLIREGKPYLLPNTIRTHGDSGMRTMDDDLASLYIKEIIDWPTVLEHCHDAEEVEKLVTKVNVKGTTLKKRGRRSLDSPGAPGVGRG
ncbi:MAG: PilT/PilU family type 4a pilus ATPase [Chloroflexi bacterium]|nr:PilT/PilU family type 4a pilus ATPase [Chloroflexota bacterium]